MWPLQEQGHREADRLPRVPSQNIIFEVASEARVLIFPFRLVIAVLDCSPTRTKLPPRLTNCCRRVAASDY